MELTETPREIFDPGVRCFFGCGIIGIGHSMPGADDHIGARNGATHLLLSPHPGPETRGDAQCIVLLDRQQGCVSGEDSLGTIESSLEAICCVVYL